MTRELVADTGTVKPTFAAWLHAFTFCLARSRFSLLVLAVGLALLLSDQGQDVLTAYAERRKLFVFTLAESLWAISIWWWSRLLLDVQYEEQPSCLRCYNFFRNWLPGVLGASAFLVVSVSAFQTANSTLGQLALIELAIFITVVILIRPAANKAATILSKSKSQKINKVASSFKIEQIEEDSLPPYKNIFEMLGIENSRAFWKGQNWKLRGLLTLTFILAFVVIACVAIVAPVRFGHINSNGPLILFFGWAATWLPIGSLMSYAADKRGIPLLTTLAICSILFSSCNDNHEIRKAENSVAVDSRPSISDGMDAWAKDNKLEPNKPAVPFVIVATAGGGIRAAYWTTTVLGNIHEHSEEFPKRTFAISGVSGGSVGATIYRALLSLSPKQFANACPDGITDCSQRILGHDLLSPLVAALLYPDLAQRFWFQPIFPDRAKAFEEGLEYAFKDVTDEDKLSSSLGSLGVTSGAPSLFLNSTWVENGRRIVASNLKRSTDPQETEAFRRSNDELSILGYDIRLSTAAHNSARFPFVSPPGAWKDQGKIVGRLQDGGLFENYGATTAQELIDLACLKFACPTEKKKIRRSKINIIPVVVLISSDPSLPRDLAISPRVNPSHFLYEVGSTFTTYEHVRTGRAAEAASRLEEYVDEELKGKYFQFRMCKTGSKIGQPPLGWFLSRAAKENIDSYLLGTPGNTSESPECYQDNVEQRNQLISYLKQHNDQ